MKVGSLNSNPVVNNPLPVQHTSLKTSSKIVDGEPVPVVESTEVPKVRAEDGTPEELHDPEKEKELMAKSIEQANASLKNYDRAIEVTVHEITKTLIYTIKDTKTNEVIAEYPPKKIQDMIAKMWELAGLVVDKRG